VVSGGEINRNCWFPGLVKADGSKRTDRSILWSVC